MRQQQQISKNRDDLNNTIHYLDTDISKTPYDQQLQNAYSFQVTLTRGDHFLGQKIKIRTRIKKTHCKLLHCIASPKKPKKNPKLLGKVKATLLSAKVIGDAHLDYRYSKNMQTLVNK